MDNNTPTVGSIALWRTIECSSETIDLDEKQFRVSNTASVLFHEYQSARQWSEGKAVNLCRMKASQLLPEGGSENDFVTAVFKSGLHPCTPQTIRSLRKQYTDQPEGEVLLCFLSDINHTCGIAVTNKKQEGFPSLAILLYPRAVVAGGKIDPASEWVFEM